MFRQREGPARGLHHVLLNAFLRGRLLDGDQRLLHIGERRQHGFAVGLEELRLQAALQLELAQQDAAVEQRLGETRRGGIEPGTRSE